MHFYLGLKKSFLLLVGLCILPQMVVSQNKSVSDTLFVDLKSYSTDFVYDMKYATTANFLNTKVYDCEVCLLRLKTVQSLLRANKQFMKNGYRIKIFDCYRPLDIQKKMWAIVSNPNYVANPAKGSIHNRGGAVDITLVNAFGEELDMGTAFDFFGEQAGHACVLFSKEILKNRAYLKKVMKQNGFLAFESEWWHYNLKNAQKEPVSNFKWTCNP